MYVVPTARWCGVRVYVCTCVWTRCGEMTSECVYSLCVYTLSFDCSIYVSIVFFHYTPSKGKAEEIAPPSYYTEPPVRDAVKVWSLEQGHGRPRTGRRACNL